VTSKKNYELIASISSLDKLKETDIKLLDAIYLGHPYCFKYRSNLLTNLSDLKEAVFFLKASGKKTYVTTPILARESEFGLLEKLLDSLSRLEVDAVEVHDVGVLRRILNDFPNFSVHLSHFLNIYNQVTASSYIKLGVKRILPSNELLITEKQLIAKTPGVEYEIPIHGQLPLGMSYACMLRTKFPSRDLKPCKQQCSQEHFLDMGDWKMRCVGTSMTSGADYSLVEYLPEVISDFYGFRLETHFDSAEKISSLARVYGPALEAASEGDFSDSLSWELLNQVKSIANGQLCNGWSFGMSGRAYISKEDINLSELKTAVNLG
jgi:putative protease